MLIILLAFVAFVVVPLLAAVCLGSTGTRIHR